MEATVLGSSLENQGQGDVAFCCDSASGNGESGIPGFSSLRLTSESNPYVLFCRGPRGQFGRS